MPLRGFLLGSLLPLGHVGPYIRRRLGALRPALVLGLPAVGSGAPW